jgi:hypothetical protein
VKTLSSALLAFLFWVVCAPNFVSAQTDSMQIHFQLFGAPVFWSFQTMIFPSSGPPVSGNSKSGSLEFSLDARMTVAKSDHVCVGCGGQNELSFTIDPTTQEITHLNINYQRMDYEGQGNLISRYNIQFDPFPYTQSGSNLAAGGHLKASVLNENVVYSGGTANGNEQGEWSATGTPTDSVSIVITHLASSNVESSVNARPAHLTISNVGNHNIAASLPLNSLYSSIEILDLLGRTVKRVAVNNDPKMQISTRALVSGCYFFRYGPEVAKFVVE